MEGMKMFLIIGALVVIGVIYLLLKRHESRMVLIAAGILMCCIAGKPMASLDAFAKSMTNAGLITSVCSCMGFAWCMKYTGCDKHLVVAIGKVLKKMGFLLIPGATLATFVVNIAIPSAAGCSAAVAYKGNDYRAFTMGFPLECISDERTRTSILLGVLRFLTEK